jgi:hypothetical protein
MKVTLDEEPRRQTWDVHPVLGLILIAWMGLVVYVVIDFLHPSLESEDAGSRALLFVLIYIGYAIAKRTTLILLMLLEGENTIVRRRRVP